ELGPVRAANGGLLYLVVPAEPEQLDLVGEQAVDAVADGGLELAGAQDAERLPEAVDQERAGELPGFRGAAPAVGDAITHGAQRRVEQEGERLGDLDVNPRRHRGGPTSRGPRRRSARRRGRSAPASGVVPIGRGTH